jgi:hypothetical protein
MATSLKCTQCGYEAKDEIDMQKHRTQKHQGMGDTGEGQNRQSRTESTSSGEEQE